ncbi:cytochrome b561 and DOMON domain-containing protein At3g25290 [Amborella trichopoda]|uniref:Cytochrome b561 and DOMON domain-containing protein n=1 Tax=Amborella trichopoda TaxID=13333 RepID=W1PWR9_AMBTC|nr:cytochrome b561 and DOMON domain-containing protein At3g25290 [Amborella trichopoda]ERN11820.1 hypothetical protein AMTR_s00020p00030660 [Amborella trichopoda]|eukprot:XP_006850239.1 cytochrome b561 and DOMON domain-containing protein At3g25290 [Amborella trichopoda]
MASSSFGPICLLVLGLVLNLAVPSSSQTCISQTFSKNRLFHRCNDLPALGAYLHWTYDPAKASLNLAFMAPPAKSGGWVAWAINPTTSGMIGAQSLIAFRQSNGSMTVKTYNISSYGSGIEPSDIGIKMSDPEAEYSGGVMTIFATVVLPGNKTTINQVWQVGSSVTGLSPEKHAFGQANLNSKGAIDLLKGQTQVVSSGNSRLRRANTHGILNAVSWGIMMPVGVIIARYLRTFKSADPAWFYLHASCQFSAYVIGVAGWATGLQLGKESKGVEQTTHRNIGIALFALGTLQVFALLLRPAKEHKYRFYWNIYHHSMGYTVIILGIINIFKGLDILLPDKKWRHAYIGFIASLGVIAVILEAITWVVVVKRKSGSSTKLHDAANGNRGRQP